MPEIPSSVSTLTKHQLRAPHAPGCAALTRNVLISVIFMRPLHAGVVSTGGDTTHSGPRPSTVAVLLCKSNVVKNEHLALTSLKRIAIVCAARKGTFFSCVGRRRRVAVGPACLPGAPHHRP